MHLLDARVHFSLTTALHVRHLHPPVIQLVVQGEDAHFAQQAQFPRRQEVEDDPEGRRRAVEEELLAGFVVVIADAGDVLERAAGAQATQAGEGELLQRAPGEGVAVSPDVDHR